MGSVYQALTITSVYNGRPETYLQETGADSEKGKHNATDGSWSSHIRNKGTKAIGKSISPLEFLKMDASYPRDILDHSDLQRQDGQLQRSLADPPLQTTVPKQEQKEEGNEKSSLVGGLKDDTSRVIKETHKEDEPEEMEVGSPETTVAAKTEDMSEETGGQECESSGKKTENKMEFLVHHDKGAHSAFPLGPGMSRQTLQELKMLLRENPVVINQGSDAREQKDKSSHGIQSQPYERTVEKQYQIFEAFFPHYTEDQKEKPIVGKPILGANSSGSDQQHSEGSHKDQPTVIKTSPHKTSGNVTGIKVDSNYSHAAVKRSPMKHKILQLAANLNKIASEYPLLPLPQLPSFHIAYAHGSVPFEHPALSHSSNVHIQNKKRDPDVHLPRIHIPLHLRSRVEHIEQEMARDDILFVRFEATDLHGVSRSKSIPARLFHEKAIHGVSMPRGYLELTLNPKDNKVDHISAINFNSDIILIPELSTFQALPWTERTARVICDSFTVMGSPLLTSPRHLAKWQLNQLQECGFSLHSGFTYEFCVYGMAEIINSKTISFPAATLLSSHDQIFIQELVDGLYHMSANVESFSSSTGPGQMEISFQPEFGIGSADSAFTFKAGIREVAKKHNYIASFFTETGFYNLGILSHSLWDAGGRKNLFSSDPRVQQLTDIGKRWLSGLLLHSAALSCLMMPTVSCRKRYAGDEKEPKECVNTTWGYNDNSCIYNIKCYGQRGHQIEVRLGSAMANPYLVLAATIAAGLDGIQREVSILEGPDDCPDLYQLKPSNIPLKLEDALVALEEDKCIREALGDTFIQYFVAMKQYELEHDEAGAERNKFLEYFI
ncbi:lengsin [Tachyglossus aculeatus]|uniref:lengsin n=1 Tax=Tachyglossus aculeatus TaxID=9261 RepID=UPI0018F652E0|nr:lengsin [Tachyglossus aculeatus]